MQLIFDHKKFWLVKSPYIILSILFVADYIFFPPETWHHEPTMFRRTVLIYVGLLVPPITVFYLIKDYFSAKHISVNFNNLTITAGKKVTSLVGVRKVFYKHKSFFKLFKFSFVEIDMVYEIPYWYSPVDKQELDLMSLESACNKNHIKLIRLK
ncbi:hypothetical protein tinsulaeT_17410 [Thalassotalea insulae]|uniref:PH domain-containing protein n=1 Tax=Thalassotalea insulae TaxID=2056778 RepID=A0ABQ6GR61_9GAMM|nr:hypothetical protein [Thalassotalea insulae]GLX78401.1 hypothetical protein tinsulaeT_17410 [Thalassotalea insulae]